jgi:hypothetical protein
MNSLRVVARLSVAYLSDARDGWVNILTDNEFNAGDHVVYWDDRNIAGDEVPSGIYFLRFQAGKSQDSRKLVLVR